MPFFASSGAMTVTMTRALADPGSRDGLADGKGPIQNVEDCKMLARGGRFVASWTPHGSPRGRSP